MAARPDLTEDRLRADDGLGLHRRRWQARTPAPKGVLLVSHGLGEHSGRYEFFAEYFAPRGWECHVFDFRGHGRSDGPRLHVSAFDEFLLDVRAAHRAARAEHPDRPVFLVGHSHGALVTLRYLQVHPDGVPGVVLSSPFLAVHPSIRPSAVEIAACKVLSRIVPSLRLRQNVDAASVSRDPAVVERYRTDPLMVNSFSMRWGAEALRVQEDLLAHPAAPPAPTLVMAAAADRVAYPDVTRAWAEKAGLPVVWWEGFYHEIFNEPERAQVFARMEAWLDERI